MSERRRKYEQIAGELEQEIRGRRLADRAQLPSERDLTARYRVDRSTIRRALDLLEQRGLIWRRPGRRTEIVPRAHEADRTARDRRVAFVCDASPQGWATIPMLLGIESILTARGYELIFASTHSPDPAEKERRELERLRRCLARQVCGIILWPASRTGSLGMLDQLRSAGIPVVLVDHLLPEAGADFAGIDNAAAASRAVEHLIGLGHRRIAHLTRANQMPTTLQRLEGFRRALAAHGIEEAPGDVLHCHPGAEEEGAVSRLLARSHPPTAILAVNDMTALRLLRYLDALGVAVPEQIAVVGIDDLAVAGLGSVPLTTVHQPFGEIGASAARLLLERIEGGWSDPPRTLLHATHLVVRASCGGSRHPSFAPTSAASRGRNVPADGARRSSHFPVDRTTHKEPTQSW